MSKKVKILIGVSSLAILALFAFYVSVPSENIEQKAATIPENKSYEDSGGTDKTTTENTKPAKAPIAPKIEYRDEIKAAPLEKSGTVTVIFGSDTTKLPVTPGTIFYDTLVEARNEGSITFSGKNYPGLGFFVTDIGKLHSGNGQYLLYYINGKEATVGVSLYKLMDGDVIEWKLE